MQRSTAWMIVFQMAFIVISVLAVGIVMKVMGYPHNHDGMLRWNPVSVWLREHGLWLLAVPCVWGCYAGAADQIDQGWLSRTLALFVGISLIAAMAVLLTLAACFPYSWYLLRTYHP